MVSVESGSRELVLAKIGSRVRIGLEEWESGVGSPAPLEDWEDCIPGEGRNADRCTRNQEVDTDRNAVMCHSTVKARARGVFQEE